MTFKQDFSDVHIKPYSLTELANLYQVNFRTMRSWIKPFEHKLGKKIGRYYSVLQVKIIFEHLSVPTRIRLDDK